MIGPKFYAWDRNGKPLAFGKLYTYQARTNTPKPTYQSEDQIVENTNPVILNGEGYANVYLEGSYKMVLKDKDENEIWSSDPVSSAQAEEWVNCMTATYVSTKSFKVGGNAVVDFDPGRKVRINNNTSEFSYSTVESSTFAGSETTIVLTESVVTTGILEACTSIVGQNSSPNFFIENVNTMKNIGIESGKVVETKGFLLAGDFGGAKYLIKTPSEAAEDGDPIDGYGNHTLINGNIAVIQVDNSINVKQFGATGDGITDDTLAIQATFNFAGNNGSVFYPKGVFKQGKIQVPWYCSIYGQSMGETTILSTATDYAFELGFDWSQSSPTDGDYAGAVYRDFNLDKQSLDKVGTGIWAKGCIRTTFTDIKIRGFNIGIDMSSACWSTTLDRLWLRGNKYGVYLGVRNVDGLEPGDVGYVGNTGTGFNGGTIRGCEIQGNEVGIYFKNYPTADYSDLFQIADGVTIRDNIIEGNSKQGIIVTHRNKQCLIDGNYFETNCFDGSLVDPTSITIDANTDFETLIGNIVVNQNNVTASVVVTSNIAVVDSFFMLVVDTGVIRFENNKTSKGVYARQRTPNFAEGFFFTSGNSANPIIDIDRAVVKDFRESDDASLPITFQGAWAAGSTGFSVSRNGSTVTISGSVDEGALSSGVIFTLPEGYRPRVRIETTMQNMFNGSIHNVRIDTNGDVTYLHGEYVGTQRANTTDDYYINASFYVDIFLLNIIH